MSKYTAESQDRESIGERLLRLQVIAFSADRQLEDVVLTALRAQEGVRETLKEIGKLLEENSK